MRVRMNSLRRSMKAKAGVYSWRQRSVRFSFCWIPTCKGNGRTVSHGSRSSVNGTQHPSWETSRCASLRQQRWQQPSLDPKRLQAKRLAKGRLPKRTKTRTMISRPEAGRQRPLTCLQPSVTTTTVMMGAVAEGRKAKAKQKPKAGAEVVLQRTTKMTMTTMTKWRRTNPRKTSSRTSWQRIPMRIPRMRRRTMLLSCSNGQGRAKRRSRRIGRW
mmetsp:Transcript_28112/g.47775  ORF Transcript_28112/g.47775 Transcript_28112/m.47775 type:complete len:215 (+) Transcript_28112:667-1311(+)